jgi:hypothetical protein
MPFRAVGSLQDGNSKAAAARLKAAATLKCTAAAAAAAAAAVNPIFSGSLLARSGSCVSNKQDSNFVVGR